jgi:hypothetical protein
MTRHTWTNRFIPPLVLIGVVGCVWYGLSSRPKTTAVLPAPRVVAAAKAPTTDSLQPIAAITPTVHKLGSTVQFSLVTKPFTQIQKVEFYIEDKFVGAAFAEPYTVQVSESNLTAGTHSVTAKVYTADTTAQTTPTLFVASPATTPQGTQGSTDDDMPLPISTATPVAPPSTPTVASPTHVVVTAGADGTQATLSWDAVAGAVNYQVWRDGVQIDTSTQPAYTDTALSPGHTYDYSVVALDADGNASTPSSQVGVTMPLQQQNVTKPSAADSTKTAPQSQDQAATTRDSAQN